LHADRIKKSVKLIFFNSGNFEQLYSTSELWLPYGLAVRPLNVMYFLKANPGLYTCYRKELASTQTTQQTCFVPQFGFLLSTA
jgi:hypothetical protein